MNELQVVEQKMVPFNGIELMAIKTNDGKIHAGVKWVCDGIGLTKGQMQNERKKIQEDLVLSKGERNFKLPTNGGIQEVLCIELGFLPLWLAKITLTPTMQKENPWTVKRLVDFQLKAKDVLEEAFFQKPKTQLEIMQMSIEQMVKQEREIAQLNQRVNEQELRVIETEKKQDNIVEILSLNPVEWRKKVNLLINKIADVRGGEGMHQLVRNESYNKLEERAKCNLNKRLQNKKQRMALEGIAESKINKVNKMDVIAEDTHFDGDISSCSKRFSNTA